MRERRRSTQNRPRTLTLIGPKIQEHVNLDVVKTADWVIDMGPEGGAAGGSIVAEGPPEWIAQQRASHTGAALARVFG